MKKGGLPIFDASDRKAMAEEKRLWLRLNRSCNNRCVFCLDALGHDGSMRPVEELHKAIKESLEDGGERLILSGGEPTLHPDFLKLVDYAREQGFGWIQTVTNGRMFAYAEFARRAASAGLSEATFSMHGHHAALHDNLVGVPGAFAQSLAGIQNLLETGQVVVNIDVVLNASNIDTLPDILSFFIEEGIFEFDLLYPVPFGRAWENKESIFFDPARASRVLPKAIEQAQGSGAVLWTNRLPPELLEGHEDLIQDPYKLHDEIRGRRAELERWLEGEPLPCREPDRCRHCFVSGFCNSLEDILNQTKTGQFSALGLDTKNEVSSNGTSPPSRTSPPTSQSTSLDALVKGVQRLEIHAESLQEAREGGRRLGFVPETWVLSLDEAPTEDPFAPLAEDWPRAERVGSQNPAVLDALLRGNWGPIWVLLEADAAAWMRSEKDKVMANPGNFWVQTPRFSGLSALCQRGVQPGMALKPLGEQPLHLVNLPACLLPGAKTHWEAPALPVEVLAQTTRIDLDLFAKHFICTLHRCFSLRCKSCNLRELCGGLPVDMAKAFGLSILKPFSNG
ncbi:MAG: radical SAM protein [Deltaproteobacteria bacterium]|nr:radical SAM protein [Deltaproteobacteria bacterium]